MTQLGVHEPGGIGRFEHDPGSGQAPVAEALPVGLVEGAGERLDDLGRGHDGEWRPSQVIGEIFRETPLRHRTSPSSNR